MRDGARWGGTSSDLICQCRTGRRKVQAAEETWEDSEGYTEEARSSESFDEE